MNCGEVITTTFHCGIWIVHRHSDILFSCKCVCILLMAEASFPFLFFFVNIKMRSTPNIIGLGGRQRFIEPGPFHWCSCPLLNLLFWCLIFSATSGWLDVSFSPVWISNCLSNQSGSIWPVNLQWNHHLSQDNWITECLNMPLTHLAKYYISVSAILN